MSKKAVLSLLAGMVLSAFVSPANAGIYDSQPSFCNAYATKAVSQNRTAQAASCQFKGLRWSDDFEGQQKWCEAVREDIAQGETRARAEALLQCFGDGVSLNASDLSMIPDTLGMEMINVVRKGRYARMQQLLAAGTDLSYEGMQGNDGTIMFIAVGTQNEKIIRFLLKLGMNPNSTFNGGWSSIATVVNNHKLLEYLLENGGDANNTGELYEFQQLPLVAAIQSNDLEAVRILIRHGAHVQVDTMMDECMADTLLDFAIKQGTPEIVAELRQAGAKTLQECTPLPSAY